MRQWDLCNPRHKLGSYDYALEDYGWNEPKIAEAFGACGGGMARPLSGSYVCGSFCRIGSFQSGRIKWQV